MGSLAACEWYSDAVDAQRWYYPSVERVFAMEGSASSLGKGTPAPGLFTGLRR